MKAARGALVLYALFMAWALSWHGVWAFAALALCSPMLSFAAARRAAAAVLLFNVGVSLGYLLQQWWLNGAVMPEGWRYLALLNLRVYLMTFATLYLVGRINVAKALSFSPTLRFLYLAAVSQIGSFVKTYEDFRLALRSRALKKLSERNRRDFLGATLHFFVRKSLHEASERTEALQARGFFDTAR